MLVKRLWCYLFNNGWIIDWAEIIFECKIKTNKDYLIQLRTKLWDWKSFNENSLIILWPDWDQLLEQIKSNY